MINEEKLQKKIDFVPFKEQKEVIDCTERELVLCAGRRFGKSAVSAYIALRTIMEREREILKWQEEKKGKKPIPAKVWIVSPTYDLSQKVFDYLVRWFLKVFPSQRAGVSSRPYPQIRTALGSVIQCKSAENPTGLLGEELDLLVVDEAAMIPRNVYERYLYPTTSSRQGRIIFISTPFGQNWFWEKFEHCKPLGAAFQHESRVNPTFPVGEWERVQKLLPEQVFNQEYKASFLPDAAAVFRGVNEIVSEHSLSDVEQGRWYVVGVDLAKHEDFTVLTVMDMKRKSVVYWDRFKQISYPLQKKRIAAVARRYNNARIIVDSTGVGQPIKDDLLVEGFLVDDISFWTNVKAKKKGSKKDLIEKLSIYIEQKHITIPAEPVLIDELKSYGYQLTDAGNVKYSAPQGMHDDAVVSLALAVWGLSPGEPEKPKNTFEQLEELEEKQFATTKRKI